MNGYLSNKQFIEGTVLRLHGRKNGTLEGFDFRLGLLNLDLAELILALEAESFGED